MPALTISVAMCTYNGERFVAEQLGSILAQQRLPEQIVVCDDASYDGTVAILRELAKNSPLPIEIIVNPRNLGYVNNFAQAIARCDGDLIALADQDDVWYPHKLATIERIFLSDTESAAVFSDGDVVGEDLAPLGYRLWQRYRFSSALQRRFASGHAFQVLLKQPIVTGATLVFRRAFRELVLPIPQVWVHDAWIALLIAALAKMVAIPEPLLQYRQHGQNQIGAKLLTTGERLHIARERGQAFYQREYQRYQQAYSYLAEQQGVSQEKLAMLAEAVQHLSVRGTLPSGRAQRIVPILRELCLFRYSRYANGVRTAIRDLLV